MNAVKLIGIWMAGILGFAVIVALALAPPSSIHYTPTEPDPGFMIVGLGETFDSTNQVTTTRFEIPLTAVALQPTWDPAAQELPVPLEKLETIARQNMFGPDEKTWSTWKVTNVVFAKFGFAGDAEQKARADRWSCQMTLTSQDPQQRGSKTACVLLDGTYVPPRPL